MTHTMPHLNRLESGKVSPRETADTTATVVHLVEQRNTDRAQELAAIYKGAAERAVAAQREFIEIDQQIQESSRAALERARGFRMALNSEIGGIVSAMKEMKSILADERHSGEMARLREFVDISERLMAIKRSGTLDAMVDTLLKIEGVSNGPT